MTLSKAGNARPLTRWVTVPTAITISGFCFSVFAGWPGSISPDMLNTISEATHFAFEGHQSPLFSLFWTAPLAILPPPLAVKLMFVVQCAAYWLSFQLFSIGALSRGSGAAALLAAVAGFLPPLFSFSVALESNVQSGTAWLLAIAIAFASQRPFARAISVLLAACGYGIRYGTIFGLASVLLTCFALGDRTASVVQLIRRATVALVAMVASSLVVIALLPGNPDRDEALWGSQIGDVVGVYSLTGRHCIPEAFVPQGTTAEAIMAGYDPALPAAMIWVNEHRFLLPQEPQALADLKRCWVRTIRESPLAFMKVKMRYSFRMLMIGDRWAPAAHADHSANHAVGVPVPDGPPTVAMHNYIAASRTWLVWRGWFWFALLAVACATAAIARAPNRIAVIALSLGVVGTFLPHFVAGQGVLSRYFFIPYALAIASILIFSTSGFGLVGRSKVEAQAP